MGEFFANYGLFLLKTLTIVIAIIAVMVVAAAAQRKAQHEGLEVENLNKKYRGLADVLRNAVSSKEERKQAAKEIEERARKERIAARKERRDAEKIALGLFDTDGGGGEDEEEEDGAGEPTADAEKVERFDSGTTVTIAAGFPGLFDDDA